ncbi:MAG: DMT family transporter [Chloroflexi bacterium]|uniref:DMT family transporter n=1 Tax=Candidatus Chlorohelix allophototropha TaxID=3003348 RepID=A0A8T7M7H9_9CHLR|nr:DMT family transporter [Chloroflexota bacterium]WJW69868.1 DMT family transporter [Chloroflexota bacterium L227-S17]
MIETILGVFLGLLGGVAVGIQSPLSGVISERVGGTSSSFIIHVSGAIVSGVLLLVRGGEKIQNWRSLPWYMFGLGSLGVVLYLTLSYTIPKLGATSALSLIVVGQLFMGLLLDTFGWFGLATRPIDFTRILAMGLLLCGSYLMIK